MRKSQPKKRGISQAGGSQVKSHARQSRSLLTHTHSQNSQSRDEKDGRRKRSKDVETTTTRAEDGSLRNFLAWGAGYSRKEGSNYRERRPRKNYPR